MATNTSIEWTEKTWNPVTGCTKISPGCKHCYAARLAKRLHAMGNPRYLNEFEVTLHRDLIDLPLRWKAPSTIFVNSMSDLYHEQIPLDFIAGVFETMCKASQHQFQVLTKRAERLADLSPRLAWAPNIWQGVTVESADYLHRVELLRKTGAHVKFLSLEPLLGPLPGLDLQGIDWVIVGGESGPGARPMDESWVLDIRDLCQATGTAFFFKQWGGVVKKRNGRLLEGRTWDQMP